MRNYCLILKNHTLNAIMKQLAVGSWQRKGQSEGAGSSRSTGRRAQGIGEEAGSRERGVVEAQAQSAEYRESLLRVAVGRDVNLHLRLSKKSIFWTFSLCVP